MLHSGESGTHTISLKTSMKYFGSKVMDSWHMRELFGMVVQIYTFSQVELLCKRKDAEVRFLILLSYCVRVQSVITSSEYMIILFPTVLL